MIMRTTLLLLLALLPLAAQVDPTAEAKLMMELEQALPRQAPAQGQQPDVSQAIDWDATVQKLGSILARSSGTRVEPHALFQLGHALFNCGQIEAAKATFEDLSKRFADHGLCKASPDSEGKPVVAQAIEDCTEELTFRNNHGTKVLPVPVLDKSLTLTLHFDAGDVSIQFYGNAAQQHRANFIELAKKGYYDRTKVHRVVPSRLIHLGDPNSRSSDFSTWGRGGPDKTVPSEFSLSVHKRGTVTMFRAPGRAGSHGSQFQILLEPQPHLDFTQTPFAEVVAGIDVVETISSRSRNQFEAPVQPVFLNGISIRTATDDK